MAGMRVKVKGRLIFQSLFNPTTVKAGDEPKYGIMVLVKKDTPEAEQLQDALDKVANDFFSGKIPRNAKTYLSDGDVDKEQAYYNGYYYFTARSSYAPDVAMLKDGALVRLNAETFNEAYYDGIEGYVSINLYGYDNRNKGVGMGLGNVCLLPGTGERMEIGAISALDEFADLINKK